jgi:hypothetical protein
MRDFRIVSSIILSEFAAERLSISHANGAN